MIKYREMFKHNYKIGPKTFGVLLAIVHLTMLGFVGYDAYYGYECPIGLFSLIVDFPIGFGIILFQGIADCNIREFWAPLLYSGIVGTLWWLILPSLIVILFKGETYKQVWRKIVGLLHG